MTLEVNLGAAGVPRHPEKQKNEQMIETAVNTFKAQYPNSIIEEPKIQFIGKNSQNITFAITAPDITKAQEMQSFFDQSLMQQGFTQTDDSEDASAVANSIFENMQGASVIAKKPWWKFW